jgi:hypothetical protein
MLDRIGSRHHFFVRSRDDHDFGNDDSHDRVRYNSEVHDHLDRGDVVREMRHEHGTGGIGSDGIGDGVRE